MIEEIVIAKTKYIIDIQREGDPMLIGDVTYMHESVQVINGQRYESQETVSHEELRNSQLAEQVRIAANNLAQLRPRARIRIEVTE